MSITNYTPDGWRTITPRIVVSDVEACVQFLNRVFLTDAVVLSDRPSVVDIGDSKLMVSDVGIRDVATASLYVYVEDTDATYQRALEAGAIIIEEPTDTPYGDRRAMIQDKWGNLWQVATHTG